MLKTRLHQLASAKDVPYDLPPTTYYLLFVTCYLLPTSCYDLALTTYHRQCITFYTVPNAYHTTIYYHLLLYTITLCIHYYYE